MSGVHSEQDDVANLAQQAVRLWAGDTASIAYVQKSENFVYRFRDSAHAGQYYLRLTSSKHRAREQILAELGFVLHLKQTGCRVSSPVPSVDANFIETFSHDHIPVHAAVFQAAPGRRPDRDFATWDQALFREWGRALGAIHTASRSYHPAGVRRMRWNEEDILFNAAAYLPEHETTAREELGRVLNWLATVSESDGRFGLIHGDLCGANFHHDGRHITAFDFDDCAYHWHLYDMVCALAPAVFHPQRRLYRQWLAEGYQESHPLHEAWQEEFDWFLRLRGIWLFIANLKSWNRPLSEHPKFPFLNALRRSFERPPVW